MEMTNAETIIRSQISRANRMQYELASLQAENRKLMEIINSLTPSDKLDRIEFIDDIIF